MLLVFIFSLSDHCLLLVCLPCCFHSCVIKHSVKDFQMTPLPPTSCRLRLEQHKSRLDPWVHVVALLVSRYAGSSVSPDSSCAALWACSHFSLRFMPFKWNLMCSFAVVAPLPQGWMLRSFRPASPASTFVKSSCLSHCSLSVSPDLPGHSPLTSFINKAFLLAELQLAGWFYFVCFPPLSQN